MVDFAAVEESLVSREMDRTKYAPGPRVGTPENDKAVEHWRIEAKLQIEAAKGRLKERLIAAKRCSHCGRDLNNDEKIQYLEFNVTTGEIVIAGTAKWSDGPNSQGSFPFGKACAERVLKTQKCDWKGL